MLSSTVAILIGFEYKDEMPCAYKDLCKVREWLTPYNYNIYTITDTEHEDDNSKIIKDYHEIKAALIELLSSNRCKRLILYYTGHGKDDSMLLPDKDKLLWTTFRRVVEDNVTTDTEIFCMLDCCNSNGLELPYLLSGNKFLLHHDNKVYSDRLWLVISSTNKRETSLASNKNGSVFTTSFLLVLKRVLNRNLNRIAGEINRNLDPNAKQTVTIYSSHLVDPVLWLWIDSYTDVVTDWSHQYLLIRR